MKKTLVNQVAFQRICHMSLEVKMMRSYIGWLEKNYVEELKQAKDKNNYIPQPIILELLHKWLSYRAEPCLPPRQVYY